LQVGAKVSTGLKRSMMRIAQAAELREIRNLICNITADIMNGFFRNLTLFHPVFWSGTA
jgi:hypothetical protein